MAKKLTLHDRADKWAWKRSSNAASTARTHGAAGLQEWLRHAWLQGYKAGMCSDIRRAKRS